VNEALDLGGNRSLNYVPRTFHIDLPNLSRRMQRQRGGAVNDGSTSRNRAAQRLSVPNVTHNHLDWTSVGRSEGFAVESHDGIPVIEKTPNQVDTKKT
jgi:hypothetical protein